jgi:ABC-type lipoprotein release transport system permease subunit
MAAGLREVLKSAAPDLPVTDLVTMRSLFDAMGLLLPRLIAQVTVLLAGIGIAMGLAGLYAVIAFAVNQKTREIGIRMALGASPRSVLRSVLRSGCGIAAAGLTLGIAGALAVADYFSEYLIGVDPHDPWTFTLVPAALLLVSLAACWIPARQASRVDPAVTLRQE